MIWFRLAALVGAASLCLGCLLFPSFDQEDYCLSDSAFTAEITERNIGLTYIEYEYTVEKMYKGDTVNMTLLGDGIDMSCGPQLLQRNTKYLIYAYSGEDLNTLRILSYNNMADIKSSDIERMENFYDCRCEIIHDYNAIFDHRTYSELPEPASNQCNSPIDFCGRSGYCRMGIEGQCTWGHHGDCYYL